MVQQSRNGRKKDKNSRMIRKMHSRVGFMFLIVVALLLVGVGRIVYLISTKGEIYSKVVFDNQTYTSTAIAAKRGELIDRNGTVLAYSQKVYTLIFDPKIANSDNGKYKEDTIDAIVTYFPEISRQQLEELIVTKPESHYERMIKELPTSRVEEFQEYKKKKATEKDADLIKGVWFEQNYLRKYPYNSLACHVLGFSSAVNGGEIGLELYYNDYLSGTDGVQHGYVGADMGVEEKRQEAVDGNNIITTLDFTIQNILDKHVAQFIEEYKSDSGPGAKVAAAIVIDPNTGEILGMSSSPSFNLNDPRDLTNIYTQEALSAMSDDDFKDNLYKAWGNFCVEGVYEPGSTMKNITVSSAFDEGIVKQEDQFECKGYQEVAGIKIHCHMRTGHGILDLKGGLIYSCNPAMMQIAAMMGADMLVMYHERFGFGRKTGIDLPGEADGYVFPVEKMGATELATNAFGQGVTVNMVQMLSAYCSIINGGYYYKPHMVKKIETSNGDLVKSYNKELERKIITEDTSALMRQYLEASVEDALAIAVKVDDYSLAGKTGTAQKSPRTADTYVVSFIGHAPADNPQYAFYFILDEPNRDNCNIGSSVPAIWFAHDTLEELLPYLNTAKIPSKEEETTSTN